jgi:hypothetical protein
VVLVGDGNVEARWCPQMDADARRCLNIHEVMCGPRVKERGEVCAIDNDVELHGMAGA